MKLWWKSDLWERFPFYLVFCLKWVPCLGTSVFSVDNKDYTLYLCREKHNSVLSITMFMYIFWAFTITLCIKGLLEVANNVLLKGVNIQIYFRNNFPFSRKLIPISIFPLLHKSYFHLLQESAEAFQLLLWQWTELYVSDSIKQKKDVFISHDCKHVNFIF